MSNPTPQDPLGITGTTIHEKYLVGRVVGEGGFSVVYKAEHTIWKQPVALKCFKALGGVPMEQRERLLEAFIQEGKLITSLSSRSAAIVQARDVGTFTTAEGLWVPYMVLEWLEGRPLDAVLFDERNRGMAPRELTEAMILLEPVIIALDLVHAQGVAHRDVKPPNIFITDDPRGPNPYAKILDFGIAKVMVEAGGAALAQTGKEITAFTPNYGAPEQFSRSHGATGPWTDVFAMALIMIELLRAEPALEGDDIIQLSVASRDPNRRPTPRQFGLEVSDAVESVFLKAVAVAPSERYATMGEFWRALHHAVFPDAPTWASGATASGIPRAAPSQDGRPTTVQVQGRSMTPREQVHPTTPIFLSQPLTPGGLSSTGTPKSGSKGLVFAIGGLVALGLGGFLAFKLVGAPPAGSGAQGVNPVASVAPVVPSASVAAGPKDPCPKGMALVPGGKFFMGSDDAALPLWQPSHKVNIDTFCMDINEVTAAEYKACSDVGECKRPDTVPNYPKSVTTTEEQHEKNREAYSELCTFGKPGLENHPINCLSWDKAHDYCAYRKQRLPTEAEWEYAARGSDGRIFPWGEAPGDEKHMNACGKECNAWETAHGMSLSSTMYDADDGFAGTAPVGSFPAGVTKFGLNDMVGNVWEWTNDWFATYGAEEVVNPKGAVAGDKKAIRGGGFNGGVQLWLNPAFRYHQLATASSHGIGFRCAKNPE